MLNQIERMRNQIFKTLPLFEEEADWYHHLQMTIIELQGFNKNLSNPELYSIICKLQGISPDTEKSLLKSVIFKSLRIISDVAK